jgi:hypothetical protein
MTAKSTTGHVHSEVLLSQHKDLLAASGITGEVAEGRSYYSLTDEARAVLSERWGFSRAQLKGDGLVVPRFRPNGTEAPPQVRHDEPRKTRDGNLVRYDSPAGSGAVVDVHPFNLDALHNPEKPIWICENVRGGDALTSLSRVAISVPGVWGWSQNKKPARDLDGIGMARRRIICLRL